MHIQTLSILILDSDLGRGSRLGEELQERGTLAIITDDLGAALEAVKTEHPALVVVSEAMGATAATVLQAADPDVLVVVVTEAVAA
jgi:ActR/RegA family two-component response regulator